MNVILESSVADSVEVSYSPMSKYKNEAERLRIADKIFISTLGLKEELVTEIEILAMANGHSTEDVIVVGEKNFGASNGQVYAKRNQADYFNQYIEVENLEKYISNNNRFAVKYGHRFIDLMSMVTNEKEQVRVFTSDHHFMSEDCRHLSKGGAEFYAHIINWSIYLN